MEEYGYRIVTSNQEDSDSCCYKEITRRQPLTLGGMYDLGLHLNPRFARIEGIYHEGNARHPLDERDVIVLSPVPESVFIHLTAGHYAWTPFKGPLY